jgi:hypothetical protein
MMANLPKQSVTAKMPGRRMAQIAAKLKQLRRQERFRLTRAADLLNRQKNLSQTFHLQWRNRSALNRRYLPESWLPEQRSSLCLLQPFRWEHSL